MSTIGFAASPRHRRAPEMLDTPYHLPRQGGEQMLLFLANALRPCRIVGNNFDLLPQNARHTLL